MQKPETQKKRRTTLLKKISKRLRFVGLLPLIFLATFSLALLFISTRASNVLFEKTLLEQKRAEILRFVQQRVETFELFVNFDDVAPIGLEDQQFFLEGLLNEDEHLLDVAIIQTITGSGYPRMGVETERCVRGDDGGISCAVVLRDRVNDPPYQVAAGGSTYVGSVVWENAQPQLVIASDIRNKPKTDIIGVIVGVLDLTNMQTIFAEAGFGNSGSVYLTDQAGRVLAHSGGEAFLNRDAAGILELIPESGARVLPAAFDDMAAFTTGLPVVVENQKWFLVAEWPWIDAFLGALLMAGVFAVFVVALLLIVQFVGIRFARAIVKPIRTVQEGAIRIGRGDFSKRVVLNTNDELEDLGDALNEMATDLAQLQRVRVAETRAQALAVAIAKEHELEEEKDTLLATASHQFRTPVTALNWNIELLKRMKIPPEGKDLLMGLEVHAKNLATIASDLLNATAFGAGYRVEPDRAPADVNRAVEEALERFAGQIKDKQITVVKQLAEPPIMVRGSFAAIRIAMEHLVSNAILYSNDKGTITITLSMSETGEAKIKVADEGIGIPEDEQKHLFNPFFRAKNAIVKKNVGTGLGLFIVNNIFTGHGGRVLAESKEGEGTTIRAYLPGVQAPPNAET